ncbi:biotin transporter BioY [Corynebacterium sp. CCM 9185]|nr:biotin transporter BioY [Corynebacterium marambiense]MCK7663074.1 biotin transporter BioY [Corynebacterium marambiense]MCX7542688.1 biotin transporter BioY [Corynebacterium marambiense]
MTAILQSRRAIAAAGRTPSDMNAVQVLHIRVLSAHVNAKSIFNVRDLAYSAVFAALIIVLGYISIPVGGAGVPIVLQNAACIMAGLILGPRRGFLALVIVFLLGIVGLPVLSQGKSVLTALSGPTVGYLLGYLLAPLIAGVLSARAPRHRRGMAINFTLAFLAAMLVQYFFGILGLMWRLDMTLVEALKVQIPFIPGAIIKTIVGVIIAVGVHAALPDLRRFSSGTESGVRPAANPKPE